jgi:hypothetical protein
MIEKIEGLNFNILEINFNQLEKEYPLIFKLITKDMRVDYSNTFKCYTP